MVTSVVPDFASLQENNEHLLKNKTPLRVSENTGVRLKAPASGRPRQTVLEEWEKQLPIEHIVPPPAQSSTTQRGLSWASSSSSGKGHPRGGEGGGKEPLSIVGCFVVVLIQILYHEDCREIYKAQLPKIWQWFIAKGESNSQPLSTGETG